MQTKEGELGMERSQYDMVRESVAQKCGSRVEICLDRGRNKVDIQKGVIKEAYPSVFTIEIDGEDIRISLSIGAFITSDKSVSFEQLFETADHVMYNAKNNGKNAIIVEENEKIKAE